MKKIWPWLLLLLLLILFCVWTKKDSIHLSSNTQAHVATTPAIQAQKQYIDYAITQKGKGYVLSGNFTNTQQQNSLSDTCTAATSNLVINGTTTNTTLVGDEAIALTNKILPHFIANYSDGKINYQNKILTVNGNVEGYEAKHEMQRLLNDSTILTQDNTNVLLVDPINFSIIKESQKLQLSGTFTNKKQIRTLSHHLRPTYSTLNIRKNPHLVDKGAIPLTEKILPSFLKHYSKGKIYYTHETLIIEGIVDSQEAFNEMDHLLSNAKIPVENLTILNPDIAKRAQEAKAAAAVAALAKSQAEEKVALAKAKAEKEAALAKAKVAEEAKRLQENAQRKADAKRKAQAQAALQAEQEKIKLAAQRATAQAKLAADTAKAKITKLLQIENIEFEVAKGSLTARGKATVDKLANILTQYSHIKAEIAGHTDSDGSAVFNQKLSQSRVDTVKNRLVSKGINANRLTAKGYGESQPLVPNTSDANKQRNRRVELNIQGE